jgi:hypothetical protein
MGISPAVLIVRVLSQRPGLIFSGLRFLAAAGAVVEAGFDSMGRVCAPMQVTATHNTVVAKNFARICSSPKMVYSTWPVDGFLL